MARNGNRSVSKTGAFVLSSVIIIICESKHEVGGGSSVIRCASVSSLHRASNPTRGGDNFSINILLLVDVLLSASVASCLATWSCRGTKSGEAQ